MKPIYTNRNKNLLNTSGKKIRYERQRTQRTIKKVFVDVFPFLLVEKGRRMQKGITQKPREFVSFKFKWSFTKFCRDCLRIYACAPQGTKILILLYVQMKYVFSISSMDDVLDASLTPTPHPNPHLPCFCFFEILQPNIKNLREGLSLWSASSQIKRSFGRQYSLFRAFPSFEPIIVGN